MAHGLSLKGQAALVTGASTGIGRAIAIAFGAAGAAVGINYKGGRAGADSAVAEIEAGQGEAMALQADVADERAVEAMFQAFIARFGKVDILVANAGIQRDAPIAEMPLADWRAVIDVNLTGQFLCARAAVRAFRAKPPPAAGARGKIIFMSSVHEVIPWAYRANYAASKGGAMLLMKSLAQELAAERIRVNSIAPGAIRTGINRAAWEAPAALEALLKLIPYGRIGEPQDVARAALWLASDLSDYVTGTTLFVDGGMALYPAFKGGG